MGATSILEILITAQLTMYAYGEELFFYFINYLLIFKLTLL